MPDGERAASLPELSSGPSRECTPPLFATGPAGCRNLHPVGRFQSITVVVAYGTNPPLN